MNYDCRFKSINYVNTNSHVYGKPLNIEQYKQLKSQHPEFQHSHDSFEVYSSTKEANVPNFPVVSFGNLRVEFQPVPEHDSFQVFNENDLQQLERKGKGTKYEYAQKVRSYLKRNIKPQSEVDKAICYLKQQKGYSPLVMQHIAASSVKTIYYDPRVGAVIAEKSDKWRCYQMGHPGAIAEVDIDSKSMRSVKHLAKEKPKYIGFPKFGK